MHNIFFVYKQLSIQFDEEGNLLPLEEGVPATHVLSYDEKPSIQAIANTADNLPPAEGNGIIKRLGTVSLLAGIDLQTRYTYQQ